MSRVLGISTRTLGRRLNEAGVARLPPGRPSASDPGSPFYDAKIKGDPGYRTDVKALGRRGLKREFTANRRMITRRAKVGYDLEVKRESALYRYNMMKVTELETELDQLETEEEVLLEKAYGNVVPDEFGGYDCGNVELSEELDFALTKNGEKLPIVARDLDYMERRYRSHPRDDWGSAEFRRDKHRLNLSRQRAKEIRAVFGKRFPELSEKVIAERLYTPQFTHE